VIEERGTQHDVDNVPFDTALEPMIGLGARLGAQAAANELIAWQNFEMCFLGIPTANDADVAFPFLCKCPTMQVHVGMMKCCLQHW
jgi:hypothetical protein